MIPFKNNWQEFQKILKRNGIDKFYHFTEESNISSISQYGGLYSWDYCVRNNIPIPKPGGSMQSRVLDTRKNLQNYVRLSFVENHPMAYAIRYREGYNKIVILEIDFEVALWENTKYSDSNAVAEQAYTPIIGETIEHLKAINFPVLKRRYFDLLSTDQKYFQAEILVLEKIPIKYIKVLKYLS